MLEKLQETDFSSHIGEACTVKLDSGPAIELEISETKAFRRSGEERDSFSVLFKGPGEPVLEQAIRPLSHPVLGELGLFLVPLGPGKDGGMIYEAVFS